MERIIYTGEPPKKEVFEVFSEAMEELILEDSSVVYIDADLMASMRTKELWKKYPERVFNTGIQEANMAGVAGGMFLAGMKPYIHSFAPFASRRAFDQIYLSIGYAGKSARIIGSEPGICAADNGGTHMTFEDMALMRSIPGACVVDVSDAAMLKAFLKQTVNRRGVTYIRTPRRGLPDIYETGTNFEEGKGKVLREGGDVTIVASGIMVGTALRAAGMLYAHGIDAMVVDPVTVKPLDAELIEQCARNTKYVVTVENHSVTGGLGSAVAECLSETYPVRMRRIGVQERFGEVGNESYLRECFNLRTEDIVAAVCEMSKRVNLD